MLSPLLIIWKIKRFLNMGSEKRYKEALKVINHYAMEIIRSKEEEQQQQEGSEESRRNQDLLSRFMYSSSVNIEDFKDKEQKRKFSRDIVISFILAGSETTSTALTWFFWLISGHPRCEQRIHEMLLSNSSMVQGKQCGNIRSYDELKKLHYLHAAIAESMRLFPPVPMKSRLAMDDDVLPDGTYERKGWSCDFSAYAMGRMDKIWGEKCREFRPERLSNDDGNFQPSDQFRVPAFHCGPRICLGKEMAYVQMKSVVPASMFESEMMAIDRGASPEKMMNPPYMLSLLLKMRGGLPVRPRRRQQ